MRAVYAVLIALLLFQSSTLIADDRDFPQPKSLTPAVEFWKRVYSEVTTQQGFIHDNKRMDMVYEKLDLDPEFVPDENKAIKKAVNRYRDALNKLGKKKRGKLSKFERKLLKRWGKRTSRKTFRNAAKRVRFQRGQADKFKAGVIRSGAYLGYIQQVLDGMNMPLELAALPHVESSFTPNIYSHAGAAGMWQFMRSTGRRFMRIDHVVDERLDPHKATVAAAQLLQNNHSVIQSWPLALTAYNHGLAGMRRAVKKTGTDDIGAIVKKYKGRTFGFASRNFYAAFLAAKEISSDPVKYFGDLNYDEPESNPQVKTLAYFPAHKLSNKLGITADKLKELNPALRSAVWNGEKFIPKGYMLRLPESKSEEQWIGSLAHLASNIGFSEQKKDLVYKVRKGDSLSVIAQRFNTSVKRLMKRNNLRSATRIRVGQELKLPGAEKAPQRIAKTEVIPIPKSGKKTPLKVAQVEPKPQPEPVQKPVVEPKVENQEPAKVAEQPEKSTEKDEPVNTAAPTAKPVAEKTEKVAKKPIKKSKPSPVSPKGFYTVRPGDTLSVIAERMGISTKQLLSMNNLHSRSKIRPGEILRIQDTTPSSEPKEAEEDETLAEVSEETAKEDEKETPVETQSELAADPSDYGVDENSLIEAQAVETLGHYAEWLDVKTATLRKLNGLSYRRGIPVGKTIRLDFSKVDTTTFEKRRQEFHIDNQASYFEDHVIQGSCVHKIGPRDNLWVIANDYYNVPFWLLRQYNPDITLDSTLRKGQPINIPIVKAKRSGSSTRPSRSAALACDKELISQRSR